MPTGAAILAGWNRAENWFAVLGLAATSIITFANVVARYVFNIGVPWAEELVRYLMIWVTFFGLDIGARDASHIGMDFFVRLAGRRGQLRAEAALYALADLIGLFFALAFAYLGSDLLLKVMHTGQLSPALQYPMWIFYLVVPVGGVATALRYLAALRRHLALVRAGGAGAEGRGSG